MRFEVGGLGLGLGRGGGIGLRGVKGGLVYLGLHAETGIAVPFRV